MSNTINFLASTRVRCIREKYSPFTRYTRLQIPLMFDSGTAAVEFDRLLSRPDERELLE